MSLTTAQRTRGQTAATAAAEPELFAGTGRLVRLFLRLEVFHHRLVDAADFHHQIGRQQRARADSRFSAGGAATGLPGGVGLPHARSEFVQHTSIAVGVTKFGHSLDFGAVDGPANLVLLHGFPEHWWQWHAVAPVIAASGYRVICPDLRGAG